jgi:hypothetical protein
MSPRNASAKNNVRGRASVFFHIDRRRCRQNKTMHRSIGKQDLSDTWLATCGGVACKRNKGALDARCACVCAREKERETWSSNEVRRRSHDVDRQKKKAHKQRNNIQVSNCFSLPGVSTRQNSIVRLLRRGSSPICIGTCRDGMLSKEARTTLRQGSEEMTTLDGWVTFSTLPDAR